MLDGLVNTYDLPSHANFINQNYLIFLYLKLYLEIRLLSVVVFSLKLGYLKLHYWYDFDGIEANIIRRDRVRGLLAS